MNALLIFLHEPIAGLVNTRMAATVGENEAVLRYKAMVAVLLEQLEGLTNTHVRFCYSPDDAGEAIAFWLLPELRGDVIKRSNDFVFTPKKNAPSFTIEFHPQGSGALDDRVQRASNKAFADGYDKVAVIGSDCIHCGARWINAAFLQTKENTCVIGPGEDGGYYLCATSAASSTLFHDIAWSDSESTKGAQLALEKNNLKLVKLPPLLNVSDEASWNRAVDSAIGGKLKTALKKVRNSG